MKQATIRSVCECQSQLEALLDEQRQVLAGYAKQRGEEPERSPAHSIGAENKRFDVGWACPICGRNTLRSFDAEALVWREGDAPAPAQFPTVQAPVPLGPGPATPFLSAPPPPVARPSATPPSPPKPASTPPMRPSAPPLNASTSVALKSLSTPPKPPSGAPPAGLPKSPPPPPPPPSPAHSSAPPGPPPVRPTSAVPPPPPPPRGPLGSVPPKSDKG